MIDKPFPLRCAACNKIIGRIKGVYLDETGEMTVDAETVLEQHEPDCPFLAARLKNTLTGISIHGPEREKERFFRVSTEESHRRAAEASEDFKNYLRDQLNEMFQKRLWTEEPNGKIG